MSFLNVDDAWFGYDEAGDGEAVVFVHGALVDRGMWDHQFFGLADRYRVVRYDWRGYGQSGDLTGPVCHHEDLLAVMDALDIDRAHLVGSSYGGAYAVEAALVAPDRVASLALWCAGLSGHEWPPEMGASVREAISGAIPVENLARYSAGSTEVDPADAAIMAAAQIDYTFVGPRRARDEVDAAALARAEDMCRGMFERTWSGPSYPQRLLEPSAKQRLAEVASPTLVVNGLSDVSYIQQVSDLYCDGIAGAQRVDMADTGHIPPLERPVESTQILSRFLGDLPLGGGRGWCPAKGRGDIDVCATVVVKRHKAVPVAAAGSAAYMISKVGLAFRDESGAPGFRLQPLLAMTRSQGNCGMLPWARRWWPLSDCGPGRRVSGGRGGDRSRSTGRAAGEFCCRGVHGQGGRARPWVLGLGAVCAAAWMVAVVGRGAFSRDCLPGRRRGGVIGHGYE